MNRICLLALGAVFLTAPARAAVDFFQSPAGGNNDRFHGHAVRDAGDVNGDGIVDFIVGAPFDNTKGADAGRAFIWFGGPRMTDEPNVVLDDGSAEDYFGFSVAGIGDVDGDGRADVAVGAPGDDLNGRGLSGSVYVYLGRTVTTSPAGNFPIGASWPVEQVFAGEVGGDRFGWSVSRAGDMNRDGVADFVVGAPYSDATGEDRGRAYLYLGSTASSLSTSPAVIWDGPATGGPQSDGNFRDFAPDPTPVAVRGPVFGWSVSDLANFDGLNRAGVVIGAPGAGGARGVVHYFAAPLFTNTLPSTTPTTVFDNGIAGGGEAGDEFGWSVSNGGLIDGDARNDLIVGAPGDDNDRGTVKVFLGVGSPPALDDDASSTRSGQILGDRFGFAVADAGDHLGTPGTWLVGAPARDNAGLDAGWVYVFDRTATLPADVLPGNRTGTAEAGDQWGFALSALGDLDFDGSDEYLVGAPTANDDESTRGVVALISSSEGVVSSDVPRWTVRGDAGRVVLDVFGSSLRRATSIEIVAAGRLVASLGDGVVVTSGGVHVSFDRPGGVDAVDLRWTVDATVFEERIALPALGSVLALRATPTAGGTELRFTAQAPTAWTLRVVDLRGRVVETIASGSDGALDRVVRFDGGVARGTYFAVLQQGKRRLAERFVVTR